MLNPSTFPAGQWAILTATVEANGPHDNDCNVRANMELLDTLEGVYNVDVLSGTYNGIEQGVSYLVHGINEYEALELAERFDQESILTADGLVYVDGRPATPRDASRDVFGPDAELEDFYSTFLSSGESFSLGLIWEE